MAIAASCVIINKDEESVELTLRRLEEEVDARTDRVEVLVVDASAGRLDHIYRRFRHVRVVPYVAPHGVAVSIAHQRNRGVAEAAADIVVFVDAGCRPADGWLGHILAPFADGEDVVAGLTVADTGGINSYVPQTLPGDSRYLAECPTINLAFRRRAATDVGGFDETFRYGSDVDFAWRLIDRGYRIRFSEHAVVRTDWGNWRRQIRRSFAYGRARARLYRKHRSRRSSILRRDPIAVAYPLFLIGLPLALRRPAYVALLAIPWWRNRRLGGAATTLDHLVYGAGVLAEIGSWSPVIASRPLSDGPR